MSEQTDDNRYDDIIDLPHHVSASHPRMPLADRAAQFSPFAALTGHAAVLQETARLTGEKVELTDEAKALLDAKLQLLNSVISIHPEIAVTRFQPDERKSGGRYATVTGQAKKIDSVRHVLTLTNGDEIPIDDILDLDSELFKHFSDEAM